MALTGCDYVLGLDRTIDGGLDDDALVATDVPPIDAAYCFGDSFGGPSLDAGWKPNLGTGIAARVEQGNLVFTMDTLASTGTTGDIASAAVNLRDRTVEATLVTVPPSDVQAWLTIGAYSMRVDSNRIARLYIGGAEQAMLGVGTPPRRIGFQVSGGNITMFSRNAAALASRTVPLTDPVENTSVQLGVFVAKTRSVPGELRWDDVSITCP